MYEANKFIEQIAKQLKRLADRGTGTATTSAGTGNIPAGFKSVSIVKTSSDSDSKTVTFSDGTTYVLSARGEGFSHSAPDGGTLPAYTFSGSGSIKWNGIK